jgi:hypothetical protein
MQNTRLCTVVYAMSPIQSSSLTGLWDHLCNTVEFDCTVRNLRVLADFRHLQVRYCEYLLWRPSDRQVYACSPCQLLQTEEKTLEFGPLRVEDRHANGSTFPLGFPMDKRERQQLRIGMRCSGDVLETFWPLISPCLHLLVSSPLHYCFLEVAQKIPPKKPKKLTISSYAGWFFPNRGVEPRATARLVIFLMNERRICYRYTSSEGVVV